MSKENFDRIDEEYAKSQQKAAADAWGFPKVYVPADFTPYDSHVPICPIGKIKPLKHKFFLSDAQKKELEEMVRPFNKLKEHLLLSTENPDPNSWLRNFMSEEMKQEKKDKILFKFGEFIGNLSKEENLSYNQIVGVLLDFVENNLKK